MRISVNATPDSTTFRIHSTRLDAALANELRTSLREAVGDAAGITVVDLAEVGFMDSAGLGALVGVLKELDPARLTLCGVQPAVRTVLRLTRVDRTFKIVE